MGKAGCDGDHVPNPDGDGEEQSNSCQSLGKLGWLEYRQFP